MVLSKNKILEHPILIVFLNFDFYNKKHLRKKKEKWNEMCRHPKMDGR